jgi:hypothetical protein
MNDVIPATTLASIVGQRDAAMAAATEGAALLARGFAKTAEALALAQSAADGRVFHDKDHNKNDDFRKLFVDFTPGDSVEAFRKYTDASTWLRLIETAGLKDLMDRTAVEQFHAELASNVPPVTEDNVHATVFGMADDAQMIFRRGLVRVFTDLDRRFRSHDGFKIGSRIVLTRVFDEYGYWSYHARGREQIHDVERSLALLDGKRSDYYGLVAAIEKSREGGRGPRQGRCEGTYFRINTFKNGNAHLWFTRDDLVDAANRELAAYYGAVLPDAVPASGPEADLAAGTRALCRDLAFYPSPPDVVRTLLREAEVYETDTILEPSAGDGAIVDGLLRTGARVDAIEVDEDRCRRLGALHRHSRLSITRGNFIQVPQRPTYTKVVMNPPFSGTHWIDHIVHAFGFLAPGGHLVAVVPASAEFGESRRLVEFREWAEARAERPWRVFQDLPEGSFAPSGTRIQTSILHLRKPHVHHPR